MATLCDIHEFNTGSLATSTCAIKTKRFDLGIPDQQKRFSKLHLVYKASSAVTVGVYVDGGAVADSTLTFASQSTLDSVSQAFSSVGKSVEIEIRCSASDFELDSVDLDYQILGSNP